MKNLLGELAVVNKSLAVMRVICKFRVADAGSDIVLHIYHVVFSPIYLGIFIVGGGGGGCTLYVYTLYLCMYLHPSYMLCRIGVESSSKQ